MKERYHIAIKKTATGQTKVREMLLTTEQAQKLQEKLGKYDNGYVLKQIELLRDRE